MKNIKLFADTASMTDIKEMSKNDLVEGYTTNPTLMRRAGVKDYASYVSEVLEYLSEHHPDGCISFEVFSDNEDDMVIEAKILRNLNVPHRYMMYVKVPILNIDRRVNERVIRELVREGISVNVTAVFNHVQAIQALRATMEDEGLRHIISVFAGRINDTGYPAEKVVEGILRLPQPNIEILWASPRQVRDFVTADALGCDIITMTPELIKKIPGIGTSLKIAALETSRQFYNDAKASGFNLLKTLEGESNGI